MRIKSQPGFTLIELMFALVAVATVAAIAIPAYQKYVARLKVNQAMADISAISLDLNKYYGSNFTYPATLAGLGVPIPTDPWGNPYRYQPIDIKPPPSIGKILKDRSLHPVNGDYDLYSMGPDGRTSTQLTSKVSQDNVIRAGSGSFIGPVSDY